MPDHAAPAVRGAQSRGASSFLRKARPAAIGDDVLPADTRAALWQQGFFERTLRNDEAIEVVARYIEGNPVRAGLVTNVRRMAIHEVVAFLRSALAELKFGPTTDSRSDDRPTVVGRNSSCANDGRTKVRPYDCSAAGRTEVRPYCSPRETGSTATRRQRLPAAGDVPVDVRAGSVVRDGAPRGRRSS